MQALFQFNQMIVKVIKIPSDKYDVEIAIKSRKTYVKKSCNWVPKHKFLKKRDFKFEINIT